MTILSISCINTKEKDIDLTTQKMMDKKKIEPKQEKISITKLKEISLQKATDAFGKPFETDRFNINGGLPEFRIELYNIYKEDDNVEIFEATWHKNDQANITVWYAEKNEEWLPVHSLEWDKGSEF